MHGIPAHFGILNTHKISFLSIRLFRSIADRSSKPNIHAIHAIIHYLFSEIVQCYSYVICHNALNTLKSNKKWKMWSISIFSNAWSWEFRFVLAWMPCSVTAPLLSCISVIPMQESKGQQWPWAVYAADEISVTYGRCLRQIIRHHFS